jgi:hypothetical protein
MNPPITGLCFMPMTLASVAGAIIALLMAAGLIVLALAVSTWDSFAFVISSMAVGEIGFMLASVALTIMAMSSLGDEHAGLAAGLVNTSNQLGGGLGLGIVAAVVAAAATKAEVDATAALGFLTCLAFVVLALILCATPALSTIFGRRVNHAGVE